MAGTRMEFKVDDREAIEMLARQAQLPGSDLMNRIDEMLRAPSQDHFRTQTAPDGTAWQPLKAPYAKRKKYNAEKILTLRGYMRSSTATR